MTSSPSLLSQRLTGWVMAHALGNTREDPEDLQFLIQLCSDPVRVQSGVDLHQALAAHLPQLPRLRSDEEQATDEVAFLLIGVKETSPGVFERFNRTFLLRDPLLDGRDWPVERLEEMVDGYAASLARLEPTVECHIEAVIVHVFPLDEGVIVPQVRLLDRLTTGAVRLALDDDAIPSTAVHATLEVTAMPGQWTVTALTALGKEGPLLQVLPSTGEGSVTVTPALVTPLRSAQAIAAREAVGRDQEDDEILGALLSGDPDVQIPPGWGQRR